MYRYYHTQAYPRQYRAMHRTLAPVSLGSVGAERNYQVPPRILTYFCFVYVRRGRGSLIQADRTAELQAHDLFLLLPEVLHSYKTDPADLLELDWIGFTGADAAELLKKTRFSVEEPLYRPRQWESLEQCFDRLRLDGTESNPGSYLKICGSLCSLFGVLLQQRTENLPWQGTGQELSRVVDAAQNYMITHYHQSLTVAETAAHVGVSRAALAAHFRRELGVTPSAYLQNIRLRQAENLLRSTNLTIAEVARAVGYGDPLYFSRVFTETHGRAPTVYRKQAKT